MADNSFDVSAQTMDSIAARVAARFQAATDNDAMVLRVAERALVADVPSTWYLPPGARGKDPITPEGTDLTIWTWDDSRFWAIAFAGKAAKPILYNTFRSDASRQSYLNQVIESRKKVVQMKKDRLDERKNYKHDYKVGDILYASWGYDQTNVNFYEVVEVVGAMIALREVAQKTVRENESADYVAAVPGRFTGPVLKRKPGVGGIVKVTDSQRAYKWDGKPKYQTGAFGGH